MRDLLCLFLDAYYIILLAYVIISWIPRPPEPIIPVFNGIRAVVEPAAAPIRKLLPPLQLGGMALDLSVLVLFVLLILVRSAFC